MEVSSLTWVTEIDTRGLQQGVADITSSLAVVNKYSETVDVNGKKTTKSIDNTAKSTKNAKVEALKLSDVFSNMGKSIFSMGLIASGVLAGIAATCPLLAGPMALLKLQFFRLSMIIGAQLVPYFMKLVDVVAQFVSYIGANPALPKLIAQFLFFGSIIGTIGGAVMKLVSVFAPLFKIFSGLVSSVGGVGGALSSIIKIIPQLAKRFGLIITAILIVGAALWKVRDKIMPIVEKFMEIGSILFEIIKPVLDVIFRVMDFIFDLLVDLLALGFDKVFSVIPPILDLIILGLRGMADFINLIIDGINWVITGLNKAINLKNSFLGLPQGTATIGTLGKINLPASPSTQTTNITINTNSINGEGDVNDLVEKLTNKLNLNMQLMRGKTTV